MAKNTKNADAALAVKLIVGIGKRFANVGQLTFAGSSYTPAQVTAKLQRLVALRADVDAAKATLKVKMAAEDAEAPSLRDFMVLFVAFVMATYANVADALADFGLKPKKARGSLTADEIAAANAKRQATRKARNVMGKKQRLEVMGDVTGVTITPVVAAPQPVATAHSNANGPTHA